MIYAGIGSRETPPRVLKCMRGLAKIFAENGHYLRTGGATGADAAFMEGVSLAPSPAATIYLPWRAYNSEHGFMDPVFAYNYSIPPAAMETVDRFHPAPERLTPWVKKLHARNAQIIAGQNLDTLAQLVICWTPKGNRGGGTGQALRYAQHLGIEIIDFGLYRYPESEAIGLMERFHKGYDPDKDGHIT